ncbi:(3,5-dihydroxyphenyl)acetyl-CoA 1,2-dioxygenase DpgC [Streptomyces syringium]|uniref:(3,5-dihydroxyphenyl)acetyl-CoA 1,2-dioxygenase DpgC n=1 Tax=Streptomyces syringium TaxID=76729 RepID=UPI0036539B1B
MSEDRTLTAATDEDTSGLASRIDRWEAARPPLGRTVREDAEALAQHISEAEDLLAALPPRPERDRTQRQDAARLVDGGRRLRDRFLRLHAESVYDALTDGRTRHPRVDELAYAAAEAFPGLVPTRARIAAELRHIQAHKEGREIDQGIFFRALLRSPKAGAHLVDSMLLPTRRALDLLPGFRRDGRADLGTVLIERRGAAAHVTINNPSCLNAEDNRLMADLETAVDLTLLDDGVRVGVLRGGVMDHPRHRGRRVFSAGINLRHLHEGRISFVDFLLGRELGLLNKLAKGVIPDPDPDAFPDRTVQKPWIGVVDSFAIGGGTQILLVLDRVIAAEDAYFSLPAAQEGIVPGTGNLRLGRLTGSRPARRIILGGHRIAATDPDAGFLCDQVVPTAGLDAAVEASVRELDSPAVAANRRMLGLAEEPADAFRAYLAEFSLVQAYRSYSEDVLEKVGRAWARPGASG